MDTRRLAFGVLSFSEFQLNAFKIELCNNDFSYQRMNYMNRKSIVESTILENFVSIVYRMTDLWDVDAGCVMSQKRSSADRRPVSTVWTHQVQVKLCRSPAK